MVLYNMSAAGIRVVEFGTKQVVDTQACVWAPTVGYESKSERLTAKTINAPALHQLHWLHVPTH